jgi:hypothetical protein
MLCVSQPIICRRSRHLQDRRHSSGAGLKVISAVLEILGDLLTPDRSVRKAIFLLGEGRNGKSVFLDLATRFVGFELANICTDLPGERLTSSAMWPLRDAIESPRK